MRYQVNLLIMVLAFRDNHHAAVPIPAGRIIDVLGSAEDDRFVIVSVQLEQFLVFESDLRERATLLVRKDAGRERGNALKRTAVP